MAIDLSTLNSSCTSMRSPFMTQIAPTYVALWKVDEKQECVLSSSSYTDQHISSQEDWQSAEEGCNLFFLLIY